MHNFDQEKLNKIAKKYCINTLYLFGSYATGKNTKLSDYDFAVILDEKIKPKDYDRYRLKINTEMIRIANHDRIDVVILNEDKVPLLLKYNIIKDGKILMDRRKKERTRSEFEIMRRWLDWQYYEDLWGKIYLRQVAAGKL